MSLIVGFDDLFASRTGLLAKHDSWEEVELGGVCSILNGFPFKSDLFNKSRGVPIVRIRDIANGSTDTLYDGTVPAEYIIKNGDLLIGMDGNFRCCEWSGRDAGLNQRVCKITPDSRVLLPKFLLYGLNGYLKAIEDATSSVTVGHLSSRDVQRIPFPIPPLAEQQRIVAKLQQILRKFDICQHRLARVSVVLKRFRQSVLAVACSGRLTADWREQLTVGTTEQVVRDSDPDLPDIPDSWRWMKLPQAGEMSRGRSRHRPRDEPSLYGGSYPFIQTGDIAQSGGRITSHRQAYSKAGLAQSRLWPAGTICITIAANIAESAILTYPACFPDSVVGIIANAKVCLPEYVEFFIRVAKADLAMFAPATAQKNINVAILSEVSVPLPPLGEQREIIRRVDALFALADKIEGRLGAIQAYVNRLAPSLLAQAFRGELVTTEAELASREGRAYEPASVLLERVQQERVGKAARLPRFKDSTATKNVKRTARSA